MKLNIKRTKYNNKNTHTNKNETNNGKIKMILQIKFNIK